jgi:hypothetical protein
VNVNNGINKLYPRVKRGKREREKGEIVKEKGKRGKIQYKEIGNKVLKESKREENKSKQNFRSIVGWA